MVFATALSGLGELIVALQMIFVTAHFWIGLYRGCSVRTGLAALFLDEGAYPKASTAIAVGFFHLCAYANEFATLINEKSLPNFVGKAFVPRTGIEPALPCDNKILSLARLPVPPSGHF